VTNGKGAILTRRRGLTGGDEGCGSTARLPAAAGLGTPTAHRPARRCQQAGAVGLGSRARHRGRAAIFTTFVDETRNRINNTNYSHFDCCPVTTSPPAQPADAQPIADAALPSGQFDTPIRSKDLFKERACIYIEHEGMIYALRSTRAGKLILTK
jgi:hemin uptake protein HemP